MDQSRLRQDLLLGFHILDKEGLNSGIAGHLTARRTDAEGLLGHGYGLGFDEVRPDSIHAADFDLTVADGGRVNPSLAFHVAIYRRRPDVGAIVHTHGRQSIALGAAGGQFVPVYQSALMLWDQVAQYDRYDGIAESEEVGNRMADALGDNRVLALRNHGIVAVGRDVAEAVCAAVIYEENSATQLLAMAAGQVHGFPEAEAGEAQAFLASPRVVEMRWRQLARRAVRTRDFLPEID